MVGIASDLLKRRSVFICQGTLNIQFYRSKLIRIINNSSFDACSTTCLIRHMIHAVSLKDYLRRFILISRLYGCLQPPSHPK
jgi:hypothetical protein